VYNEKYYDRYKKLKRDFRVKFTLSLAEILSEKPLKVLDLGCGIGTYSEEMIRKGHRVTSIDISKEALFISKKRGIRNLIQSSASDLPFKSNLFDVILFIDVIEHIKEPEKALVEIHRILRRKGLLILATQYPSILGKYIYMRDPTHQKIFTVKEITVLLSSTNFRDIYVSVGSFLPRLYPFNLVLRYVFKTITTIRARK